MNITTIKNEKTQEINGIPGGNCRQCKKGKRARVAHPGARPKAGLAILVHLAGCRVCVPWPYALSVSSRHTVPMGTQRTRPWVGQKQYSGGNLSATLPRADTGGNCKNPMRHKQTKRKNDE